jgi:hypothetical protein
LTVPHLSRAQRAWNALDLWLGFVFFVLGVPALAILLIGLFL